MAEDAAAQQHIAAGVLWSICQVSNVWTIGLYVSNGICMLSQQKCADFTFLLYLVLVQARCNLGTRSWLHWAGLPSIGSWLARADGRTRRAAVLELLPLLHCANTLAPEPDMVLAHACADVVVGMCSLLQQQLSMPGASKQLSVVYQ